MVGLAGACRSNLHVQAHEIRRPDGNDGHLPDALRDGFVDLGMREDIVCNLETVSMFFSLFAH
jgi:hypothetical protein